MSIFGSIMSKIFGHAEAASGAAGGNTNPTPAPGEMAASAAAPATSAAPATGGGSPPSQPVDVEAVLSGLAAKNPQKLNWQTSIVDLMKLLDLDSSLGARTELAKELHYTGDTNDSASMNIWLHKQVMQKLAENGGKVPESLRT